MKYENVLAVNAVSAGSSINGLAVDTSYVVSVSAVGTFTGTPVGTLKLQASNDTPPNLQDSTAWAPTNWTDISGATAAVSGAGSYIIPATDVSYMFVRVVYTRSSSTGSLTARMKTVGY